MGDDEASDYLAAITIGLGLIGPAAAWALGWWEIAGTWLVDHHVLVDQKTDPLWTVPGLGGAGVDLLRAVVAVAALVAIIATAALIGGRRKAEP